jgi:hypothetical protein
MSESMIEYGATRPTWADDQFGQWLIAHCPENGGPTLMPYQLVINGAVWIKEQFKKQSGIEPAEETAREMFACLVTIHFSSGVHQQEIFQQMFEAYLRTIPAKA